MNDKELWTRIQKERGCKECFFFDETRQGENSFCTYGGKLEIEQTPEGELCKKRRFSK